MIKRVYRKIKANSWMLRSIFKTIYFNFHYLPFRQAVKLPILLYKPHFYESRGKIFIDSENIRFGMIRLGVLTSRVYPNSGILYTNQGGEIHFKGACQIGNSSAIIIGENGNVIFGDDFRASGSTKITSCIGIEFGVKTRLGWDTNFMDTSFHPLYDMENKCFKKAYGKITIGDDNWFSSQCVIMHSVTTPERCIFGMRSIVTRGGNYESYCVHGGSPIKVLTRGVMRYYGKDIVKEYL